MMLKCFGLPMDFAQIKLFATKTSSLDFSGYLVMETPRYMVYKLGSVTIGPHTWLGYYAMRMGFGCETKKYQSERNNFG